MTYHLLATDVRRTVRSGRFLIFTIGFPVVFFVIFANLYGHGEQSGVSATTYLMTEMAVFGGMGAAINAGARIALERQIGWNRQLRLTPLRPRAYLRAKLLTGLLVALPSVLLLFACGALFEGVHLTGGEWLRMAVLFMVALVPLAVLGIAVGYLATGDSVPSMSGATLMVLSLLGGVWVPVDTMPDAFASIAHALPSYWLGVAARSPIGTEHVGTAGLAVMAAWTLALGAFVVRRYRVDAARA
jgi:ABC-2 type transport system permease protein